MQIFISTLALAAALINAPHIAGAADVVPKFDIAKNCEAETADASGISESISSCTGDEERARQELAGQWDQFDRQDRAARIRATSLDGTPSYVELQTCLEIAVDNKTRLKVMR